MTLEKINDDVIISCYIEYCIVQIHMDIFLISASIYFFSSYYVSSIISIFTIISNAIEKWVVEKEHGKCEKIILSSTAAQRVPTIHRYKRYLNNTDGSDGW